MHVTSTGLERGRRTDAPSDAAPMAVSFPNGGIELSGHLRVPPGFDDRETFAALVLATPGSSVKEQIGANYAQALAGRGFVTLTFDPSHQGASGGEPRDLEDPARRVEDIRCAIDFLLTRPYVDEDRVGLLGICAGGGYAINAALTERRVRAVGTVVAVNVGRARRQGSGASGELEGLLEAVGEQRTSEARGDAVRRDPWIPDTPQDAEAAGITDPDVLEAVDYYRTPRGRHERSTNRKLHRSDALMAGFDAFHLVPELLIQPLQVIVGGRRASTGSHDDGRLLCELARDPEDLHVVEGAAHYDMYDTPEHVEEAADVLGRFFTKRLPARRAA